MNSQTLCALLAAGSYWDIRKGELDLVTGKDISNDAPLPAGWVVLTQYDRSGSGIGATNGFSARVYQNKNTGDIVISYAGTEFDTSSYGLIADFISGNVPLAIGRYGEQAFQAALLYQQVKADSTLSDNISFTGHSLGGGLASVMAVWFDRPAYVFAPAPFQKSADSFQSTIFPDKVSALVLPGVRQRLGDAIDPALRDYDPSAMFAIREANVHAWAIKGELLESQLGMFNWIEGSTTPLFNSSAITLDAGNKHSIDLHAAALLAPNFETQAIKLPNMLALLMSNSLYGGDVLGSRQVIVTKLLRNEVGVRSDSGAELLTPTGMLSHFTNDLQKLSTNLDGLNLAAQDAILAQGIEWYYWQGSDYAGREFFSVSGEALQYTTAQGASLPGAQNKAAPYINAWLESTAAVQNSSMFRVGVASGLYQQWTVASTIGASASAQDTQKTQIFVGGAGNDSFTGGREADMLMGGDGSDALAGGLGNDKLVGGTGTDTYVFGGQFAKDLVLDADGQGLIQIDGQVLGSAKASGKRDVWTARLDDGQFIGLATYADASSPTGHKLVITRAGSTADTITINNFDLDAAQGEAGYLGIKLQDTPALVVAATGTAAVADGNPFQAWDFDPNTFTGSSTTAGSKSFTVYFNQAVKAGASLVLHLADFAGQGLKAILGDQEVDAEGAIITLDEGQTQVGFALVQRGGSDAAAIGALTVTLQQDELSTPSNEWNLTFTADTDSHNTFNGEINKQIITLANGEREYLLDADTGNFVADQTTPVLANAPDIITGSWTEADTINGLGGDDALAGGGGDDVIDGGDGTDILMGGLGADTLKGGAGDDAIYGSSTGVLPHELNPDAAPVQLPGGTVIGRGWGWATANSDVLFPRGWMVRYLNAELVRDQQAGDSGNHIEGGAGDDHIYAGTGDDLAEGGDDNDQIAGMAGSDVLLGDAGDDLLVGDGDQVERSIMNTPHDQQGADFLDGGLGNDRLFGQGRADTLFGGAGDDVLWGDDISMDETPGEYNGDDYLDGEDGNDTLVGGGKDDQLYGGAGNDVMQGDGLQDVLPAEFHGQDYMDGQDGDDRMVGGGKADQLFGGSGNDTLMGDAGGNAEGTPGYLDPASHGDDFLDGEDGNDTLVGEGGSDTLFGGSGDDLLLGDTAGTALAIAFHGDDYLDGGDGNDTLAGGGKDDQLFGGAGIDELYGDDLDAVAEGHGHDWLDGGADDDLLFGGGAGDDLFGGGGNDRLRGDGAGVQGVLHGDDYLEGGDGNDTLQGDGGADTLYGGAGDDRMDGDAADVDAHFHGDDYLDGGDGNDIMIGGGGADTLMGGAGNDIIVGGDGDELDGGEGDDVYMIVAGRGAVRIMASAGNDLVQFDSSVTLAKVSGTSNLSSLVLNLGADQTLELQGNATFLFGDGVVVSGDVLAAYVASPAPAPAPGDVSSPEPVPAGPLPAPPVAQPGETSITNLYDAEGNAAGSSVIARSPAGGNITTIYSGPDGSGDRLSDSWTEPDGSYGAGALDGGYFVGAGHYPDGTSTYYADNGAGSVYIGLYDPDGTLIQNGWTGPNGSHGDYVAHDDGSAVENRWDSDGTYYRTVYQGDGSSESTTLYADGGSARDTTDALHVSRGARYYADGSYRLTTSDGLGNQSARSYLANGEKYLDESYFVDGSFASVNGTAGLQFITTAGEPDRCQVRTVTTTEGSKVSFTTLLVDDYLAPNEVLYMEGRGWSAQENVAQRKWLFEDREIGVRISNAASNGHRYIGIISDPSSWTDLGLSGTAIKATHFGVLFQDDGHGNVLVMGPNGDMWIHADGSHGVDYLSAAVAIDGFRFDLHGDSVVDYHIRPDPNEVLPPALTPPPPPPPPNTLVFHIAPRAVPVIAPAPPPPPLARIRSVNTASSPPTSPSPPTSSYQYEPVIITIGDRKATFTGTGDVIVTINPDGTLTYGCTGGVVVFTDPGYSAQVVVDDKMLTWSYDVAGRPTGQSIQYVNGSHRDYTYDAEGNMTGSSVSSKAADGSVVTLKYGPIGQFAGSSLETHPSAGVTHTDDYDDTGALTGTTLTVTDGHGNTGISRYDAAGALLSFTTRVVTAPNETTITHYNALGNVTGVEVTVVLEGGVIRTDVYDAGGKLLNSVIAALNAQGNVDTGNYDAAGNLTGYVLAQANAQNDMSITTYDVQGHILRQDILRITGAHEATSYDDDGSRQLAWWHPDGTHGSEFFAVPRVSASALVEQTATEDLAWTYRVPADTFADRYIPETLTYTATLADGTALPFWLSFNAPTLDFSGIPANGDVGVHSIKVTATDSSGATASTTFALNVGNVNDAPTAVGSLAQWNATTGHTASYTVPSAAFADVDAGDVLSWKATLGDDTALPAWLSFDPAIRTFSGTPGQGDTGDLVLKIIATDGGGLAASQAIALHVDMPVDANAGLTLMGTARNDKLVGGAGNDTLDGGAGNDRLAGGTGNDTYAMARGYGSDKIEENDATAGNHDVARFGDDIRIDQLWFQKRGHDLQVSVIGTRDKLTIAKWFEGAQHHIEEFRTSDGKALLDSQVQNLVDAMAEFSPPHMGQTTLPHDYQQQLAGMIAANWH